MAKLADALASGASGREVVQVQVLFRAHALPMCGSPFHPLIPLILLETSVPLLAAAPPALLRFTTGAPFESRCINELSNFSIFPHAVLNHFNPRFFFSIRTWASTGAVQSAQTYRRVASL